MQRNVSRWARALRSALVACSAAACLNDPTGVRSMTSPPPADRPNRTFEGGVYYFRTSDQALWTLDVNTGALLTPDGWAIRVEPEYAQVLAQTFDAAVQADPVASMFGSITAPPPGTPLPPPPCDPTYTGCVSEPASAPGGDALGAERPTDVGILGLHGAAVASTSTWVNPTCVDLYLALREGTAEYKRVRKEYEDALDKFRDEALDLAGSAATAGVIWVNGQERPAVERSFKEMVRTLNGAPYVGVSAFA